MLTLALSKGRLLDETLPLLAQVGIEPTEDLNHTRKLIIPTSDPALQLLIVRATDTPVYVAHGAAHLGVVGVDTLREYASNALYEPLDLRIGRCRLMLAGVAGAPTPTGMPRIATKYVRLTQQYYAAQGLQVEIIKLYGSMELAPLVGLADYIVDLVSSGSTLKANGLTPLALIQDISARLVVNKAAFKLHNPRIRNLLTRLEAAVNTLHPEY